MTKKETDDFQAALKDKGLSAQTRKHILGLLCKAAKYQGFDLKIDKPAVKNGKIDMLESKEYFDAFVAHLEAEASVVADMMLLLFIRKYFQRPIHLFGIIGVLMILLGIGINIYLLIVKFGFGQDIGNRPLLIFGLMFILGGIQLFTIGIVMELLIRTYYESQNKRPYRIKNVMIGGEVA